MVGLGVIVLLFFFDPAKHSFYPFCPLYRLTGLQCPGCGCLRAAHHLLHGEFAAAFHFNALLVVLLPVIALWLALWLADRATGRDSFSPLRHRLWLWLLLGVVMAFGIGRNLPALF